MPEAAEPGDGEKLQVDDAYFPPSTCGGTIRERGGGAVGTTAARVAVGK